MDIGLFIPCVIDQFFPDTGKNVKKVLQGLGCKVFYQPDLTCCGQPGYHAGDWTSSRDLAYLWCQSWLASDYPVVIPDSSCVRMIRNAYSQILADEQASLWHNLEARTFEFSEFLWDVLEIRDFSKAICPGKATYLDTCAALRDCGIHEAPRGLLGQVRELKLIEMQKTEQCCGFGGIFTLQNPSISLAMAEQKVDMATATQADFMISSDMTCLMHVDTYIRRNRKKIKTLHIADVLAMGW